MNQRVNELPPLLARYVKTCDSPANVPLPTYLCLALLSGRVKKRLFGREYLTIGDPFDVFGQISEVGALIASRSDGNLSELAKLVSSSKVSGSSLEWFLTKTMLDNELSQYAKYFTDPPPSLWYFQNALAWINLNVGWPADNRRIAKALESKMDLDDCKIQLMLSSARVSFSFGIAYALAYPQQYSELGDIDDSLRNGNDQRFGTSQTHSQPEQIELYVKLSREWAQLCRPDLAYLLEDVTGKPRDSAQETLEVPPNLTKEVYKGTGLPSHLDERLSRIESSGLLTNPSLPWFLWLTHVSDHIAPNGSVQDLFNFGKLAASLGAVCQVGGVVGSTTDVATLALLSLTVDPISISEYGEEFISLSVSEYWQEACRESAEALESYSMAYGSESVALLPLYVYSFYESPNLDNPDDVVAIKRQHDRPVEIRDLLWKIPQANMALVNMAFAVGIALVRNHRDTVTLELDVLADEQPDPATNAFRNPQNETNLKVGSMYSRRDQLHLCRVWSALYRPEAKPLFDEIS